MRRVLTALLPIGLSAVTIQTLQLEGLHQISPVTAKMKLRVREGGEFSLEKVDQSIVNLYRTGYFQQIEAYWDPDRRVLKFRFIEKPTIGKIKFKNVPEDLRKLMEEQGILLRQGQLYSPTAIEKMKRFIEEYYRAKGYLGTFVEVESREYPRGNLVDLTVVVSKGEKVPIREVDLIGASPENREEIVPELTNRPRGFWSLLPFTNPGELKLFELPKDWKKIREFYYNRGYMDANVSAPFAKVNRDSYFADIIYQVSEGPQYRVKRVSISYPPNIKVELPELKVEKGKYFNISAIQKDIENISHAFQNLGYAFPRVVPQFKKEGEWVSITYQVEPGEIYYIHRVYIRGNQKTMDRVIRRYIYLLPGEKFSYKKLEESRRKLLRSGYFEKVKIQKKRYAPHLLDLEVDVKEGLTGSLTAGISYGSYAKWGFSGSLRERNIFGTGQSVTLSANISSKYSYYKFDLLNPSVLDTPYSFRFGLFDSQTEALSYTSSSRGWYIGGGREWTPNFTTSLTYYYSHDKLSDYAEDLEDIRPDTIKRAVTLSARYNDTDNFYFPTTGVDLGGSWEVAGFGGDDRYWKILLNGKYYYPLLDDYYQTEAVFRIFGKVGYIKDLGYTPLNERFYLGGYGTIRGYQWYSISPRDKNGNEIGGYREFVLSPSVATPLSEKMHMWLSLFYDYGGVGVDSIDIIRSSYGVSINWITPMAPITFTWAWPVIHSPDDDLQRFEFNLGMQW